MSTPSASIKVYCIDGHPIVELGLRNLFAASGGLELAGFARDVDTFVARARRGLLPAIDVMVVEVVGPGVSGIRTLERVSTFAPGLPVIVHTRQPENGFAIQLLERGAAALTSKERDPSDLVAAIRAVHAGDAHSNHLGGLFSHRHLRGWLPHEALSGRESEVLFLYASGQSPSEIADVLGVSPSTVSAYFRRIRDKLGVERTGEIVTYAFRHELVR